MLDELQWEHPRPECYKHFIDRVFHGGISLGDFLVKKSELMVSGDEMQISLEYIISTRLPDIENKTIKKTSEYSGNPNFSTFTRNTGGLFVVDKPGIIYGGSMIKLCENAEQITPYKEISLEAMALIDRLRVGSRGLDLYAIGEYVRYETIKMNRLLGIRKIRFN
jgi:hypothetical protein